MAGVVTTAGTVFARILMGNICDMYGPRLGAKQPHSTALLGDSPAFEQNVLRTWGCAGFAAFLSFSALFVASMSLVENAAAYICMRLAIGFGLATFVANQYWTSALFTPSIVGLANAVAGGWGNAGMSTALPVGQAFGAGTRSASCQARLPAV